MNSVQPHAFGAIDWIILVLYAGLVLGIGFHFSRRQRTTEEYFVGNRRMPPFIAGISIFTATTSVLSYLGTPGEYVQYGPAMVLFVPIVLLPFGYFVVAYLAIPPIMRLPITSAYELLQGRLGLPVRQAGSIIYIIGRLVWMALILYTATKVFLSVVGCAPHWAWVITIVIGAITTTYTLVGGIRTVMITEVVQFFLLLLGALLTVASISVRLGGISAWLPRHWESHWPRQPFFSADPHVRVTLVGCFVVSMIQAFANNITDQATVQRFLTTRDARAARRAYLLNAVAVAVVYVILGAVGAALLVFYRRHADLLPPHMSFANNGDLFFPQYISAFLPTGISGLIVASLMAAAMSCLAAGINSTLTIVSKDFVEVSARHSHRSEAQKMRIARGLAIVVGVAVVVGSIGMGSVTGDLFEISSKTVNLLLCPICGLFCLALFVKFATPFGAIMGALYSSAAAILVGYWDVFTGQGRISFQWIAPVSLLVSLGCSCLFSLLPTRGRRPVVLGAYTAAVLLPLAAAIAWLVTKFQVGS